MLRRGKDSIARPLLVAGGVGWVWSILVVATSASCMKRNESEVNELERSRSLGGRNKIVHGLRTEGE
jgi:hypothetical protein